MKTRIKYAHGKGFSKNLASVTVIANPRTSREIQANIEKARPGRHSTGQAYQLF